MITSNTIRKKLTELESPVVTKTKKGYYIVKWLDYQTKAKTEQLALEKMFLRAWDGFFDGMV